MKKWQSWLRANLWIALPVLLVAGAAVAAVIILRTGSASAAPPPVCQGATAGEFSCWQARYNAMVAQQSPEAAFVDFKANYNTNPFVKSDCHQIAHVIGRAAARKYKTLEETYKHGDQFCWSGYYHGAIETVAGQIGPAKIVAQLPQVCASFFKTKPYGFDHYNCVHGMGHGLMAVEGDNLFKSLDICNSGYKDTWEQDSCFSGVFMENVMNEINPGQHSNYLKKDDPLYPCTAVKDRYKQQCYLMQTSHALIVENYDYNKVFSLCDGLASPYDATCLQSLGRDVSGQSGSDQARTIELCMEGPSYGDRDNCFTGAVKDFISYFHSDKQGLAMCAAIPDASLSSSCTSVAHSYYQSF